MNLHEQWKQFAGQERTQKEYDEFWKNYFETEKNAYEHILENKEAVITGKLSEVSAIYSMNPVLFTGFIDGINTSLVNMVDMDSIQEDSDIKMEVDFEKLYFNMMEAKADWLYNLPQWDGILDEEKRKEITVKFRQSKIASSSKIGRNDPCLCGSGKKYKKCCGA